MSTHEHKQQLAAKICKLPPHRIAQVIDFIDFLQYKDQKIKYANSQTSSNKSGSATT